VKTQSMRKREAYRKIGKKEGRQAATTRNVGQAKNVVKGAENMTPVPYKKPERGEGEEGGT